MKFSHIPVLLDEVIEGLNVKKNHWYIDGTLGGGGYTEAILKRGGNVLGIDLDANAIAASKERLLRTFPDKEEGKVWTFVQDNFRNIDLIVDRYDIHIEGIVFDLGVSSYQLDTKERGFSYRFDDAILDMRLNQSVGIPASTIVQKYSEEELYEIFTTFGEEERARAIAHAIVGARKVNNLETVGALRRVIAAVVPNAILDETCSRVFQAIRIVVNDELGSLKEGIDKAQKLLATKGRIAIVSFHSLEDRIVKQKLRQQGFRLITKNAVRASEEERKNNYRSRSAKLRIAEKI